MRAPDGWPPGLSLLYPRRLVYFPPEQLSTPRLVLRRAAVSDAESIFARYAQDPEVTRYMMWTPHSSVEETRVFLGQCEHAWQTGYGHRPWVITLTGDRSARGMIGVDVGVHGVAVGYALERPSWGKGYMTEALIAVCEAALRHPGIYRVWAFCDVDNRASARVLEKAGMQCEGTLHRFALHPNLSQIPRDCYCYARVR